MINICSARSGANKTPAENTHNYQNAAAAKAAQSAHRLRIQMHQWRPYPMVKRTQSIDRRANAQNLQLLCQLLSNHAIAFDRIIDCIQFFLKAAKIHAK